MGTLGGFAPPFGPPPAAPTPLASLGLAIPSRDGAPPARARAKRAGWVGWAVRPEGPAGSPREEGRVRTGDPEPFPSASVASVLSVVRLRIAQLAVESRENRG